MDSELKNNKIKDLVEKLRPLSYSLKLIVFISMLLEIDEDLITENNNIDELLKISKKKVTRSFILEKIEERFSVNLIEFREKEIIPIHSLTKYILDHTLRL